jgi:hypothetical protein
MTHLGSAHTPKTYKAFAEPGRLPSLGLELDSPIHPLGASPFASPQQTYLDLEDLVCFEVVDRQFQKQGVTFTNAIALHPSNPAFPARSGQTLLMGAPHPGLIEARFHRPVSFISAFVTASRPTVLSAYDSQDRLIAETTLKEANLEGSDTTLPPNIELCLCTPHIHRVVFSAVGGHLTIDDVSFSS